MFRDSPDRRPPADLALGLTFNGNSASDCSPYAHAITLNGNAAVTGKALSLDGAGDWASAADHACLDMPSAFAVSMWFEPSTPGSSYRTLLAKERTSGNQRSYYFAADYSTGRYDVAICSDGAVRGAANSVVYYFSASIPSSGWNHFACVYDGAQSSGNRFKLWINGASVSASTLVRDASGLSPFNCNRELQIGTYDGTLGWKGNLDDFFLFRRALTANEVKQLYYRGRS